MAKKKSAKLKVKKPVKTGNKQMVNQTTKGRFQKGKSGNPNGRPRGKNDLRLAFEATGGPFLLSR